MIKEIEDYFEKLGETIKSIEVPKTEEELLFINEKRLELSRSTKLVQSSTFEKILGYNPQKGQLPKGISKEEAAKQAKAVVALKRLEDEIKEKLNA